MPLNTHGTMLKLIRKVEGMDNYFSLPLPLSGLHDSKIYSCSTVYHNRKSRPANWAEVNETEEM
jgi:hypothetical protein